MTVSALFGTGLLSTGAFAIGVVTYLRLPLRDILAELCGSNRRAEFWLAVSVVCMTILPLIFAMSYTPTDGLASTPMLEIAAQVKWGLAGLLMAVIVIACILSTFISRHAPIPPAAAAKGTN
jgi:uncharacterized membrane protein YkvI